jgi:hypothetical protein
VTQNRDELGILIISDLILFSCHFYAVLGMIIFSALANLESAVGFKFKSDKLESKP